MNYYAAPMEGLTDRIWRQAHQRWFGAPEAPVPVLCAVSLAAGEPGTHQKEDG